MKSINIKVKYLIVVVLAIALVINFKSIQVFGYELVGKVNKDLGNQLMEEMKVTDIHSANAKLKNVIKGMGTPIYNLVIIESGSTLMGQRVNLEDANEVMAQYKTFKRKRTSDALFQKYTINVSLIQWYAGLSDEAVSVINEVDESKLHERDVELLHLIRSNYYLSLGDYNEALEMVQVEGDYYPLIRERIANYIEALMRNSIIDSRDNFIGMKQYTKEERDIMPLFDNICKNYYLDIEAGYSEDFAEKELSDVRKIKGRITIDNEPVYGAIVYLDEDFNISSGSHFSKYIAVTDETGYYELPAFTGEDNYVGIGVPWQLIHDKQVSTTEYISKPIQFDDDNVAVVNYEFNKGAYVKTLTIEKGKINYEIVDPEYNENRDYRIEIGYSSPEYYSYSGNSIEILDGERLGSISLDKARMLMKIRYAYSGGMDDFQLKNFIEPLYLSSNYYFQVHIYDETDEAHIQNGFFTGSLRHIIYIEGETLSEGDQLIEEGDMEGAIKWFEKNESRHGLKILTALYDKGYIDTNDNDEYAYYHGGRDVDKAIYYAEKLVALDESNDTFLAKLQGLYEHKGDYDQALALFEKRLIMNPDNKYMNMQYGKCLINVGRFNEGIQKYIAYSGDVYDDDRYYDYLIVANQIDSMRDYYQNLYEDIDVTDYKPLFELVIAGKYGEAYEFINEQPDSDLKSYYSLVFVKAFRRYRVNDSDNFVDYYVEETNKIGDEHLKAILKELVEIGNWFY